MTTLPTDVEGDMRHEILNSNSSTDDTKMSAFLKLLSNQALYFVPYSKGIKLAMHRKRLVYAGRDAKNATAVLRKFLVLTPFLKILAGLNTIIES